MRLQYKFIKTAFTESISNKLDICCYLMKEVINNKYEIYVNDDMIFIDGIYLNGVLIECILDEFDNGTYKIELYKNNDDSEEILTPYFTDSILEAYKQFKLYYEHSQKDMDGGY